MARRKKIIILPQLKDRNGDLKKEWFVQYSYRDAKSNEMRRVRISVNANGDSINSFSTALKRKAAAESIIIEYTKKLNAGWLPDNSGLIVYEDQLTYHTAAVNYGKLKQSNRNIRFVSSTFFEYKKEFIKNKTFNSYLSKLRLLVSYCETNKLGDVDIQHINNEVIKNFFLFIIKQRNLDKITVKKYRQTLSTFFKWAIKKYNLKENPVYDIEIPVKKVDNAARPFLQSDFNKLLDAIETSDPQLYLAMLFQYFTAIRPGNELHKLRIKDIDFYNNQAVVNAVEAKKERRIAKIPKQLVELMIEKYALHLMNKEYFVFGKNRVSGPDKVGQNTLRDRFNQHRDRLNLPTHYKFYSSKHTGAGKLLESGKTIAEVSDWCGHTSTQHTEHYIKRHFGIRNERVINDFPNPHS